MLRLLMLVACAVLGCYGPSRPETAAVSGTVTVDGKPLEKGGIVFLPEFGRMARGAIENGQIIDVRTFEASDGVIVGPARVGIQPAVIKDAKRGFVDEMGRRAGPGEVGFVPPKYATAQRSGLTVEIESGTNELEFALTSR